MPFPRDGTSYLVLSTGDATQADQADQPGAFPSFDYLGATPRSRGDSAFDVSSFDLTFNSAAGGPVTGCFGFDFRFLSEEYPTRLDSPFTDTLRGRSRQRDGVERGWRRDPGARQLRLAPRRPAGDRQVHRGGHDVARRGGGHPVRRSHRPAACPDAAGQPSDARLPPVALRSRRPRLRQCGLHRQSQPDPAQRLHARGHVSRSGRRDHGPDDRHHRRHPDADAHGHGHRAGHGDGADLRGTSGGGLARPDAARRALGQFVVRRRERSRARPIHRPGHADHRPRHRWRQRAVDLHGAAAPGAAGTAGLGLEPAADPRRPRRRRDPRRPGHVGRLVAAGPRQDVRCPRDLGRRLHQVRARQGPRGRSRRRRGSCR